MGDRKWYEIKNVNGIASPCLLVYPERIENNIRLMLSIVGDADRLRPHIKTHKTAEIVQMQQKHGIQKFKCATIAEAELLGQCGAQDVLLAMQPVGANIQRFFDLMEAYADSRFSTFVDNPITLAQIADTAANNNKIASLYLDVNTGMDRTGCIPNERSVILYKSMEQNPNISAKGLHAYDGHIRNTNLIARTKACDADFAKVLKLKDAIEKNGHTVETIIAGGSPTFPIHAKRLNVEVGPGTTLLWDARYSELFPDMPFQPAAVLLTRIISKPAKNILCFDLGHKSVAPEMDFPRVLILGLEDSMQISQSEEHLVVKTARADEFEVGDAFYAIPMHVCPTVAKYDELLHVREGKVTGTWKVVARGQKITI